MSLTQEEFLEIVNITSPDTLNIWYSNTVPLTVFGLTIPVLDNIGTNTTQLLQSAQQINISINSQDYAFSVLSKTEITTILNSTPVTYYFFDTIDQVINSLADDTPNISGQVIYITPGFQNTNFFGGDYDILLNNVEDNRDSAYIMVSDRYSIVGGPGSTNPTNIDAIRNLTADKASVQDSSYSITGWINARYDGTPTDSTTYGGIDSAITGKSFEASFFPGSISTTTINQQISSSQVIYSEYLGNVQESLPTIPTIALTKYTTVLATISPADTQILIQLGNSQTYLDIFIGDIIIIDSDQEYMRVENIQLLNDNILLTVTRRWNNTPTGTYNTSGLDIEKIKELTKVYQIRGNRVQGIQKGQLVVKGSQEILNIDTLGQVVG